MRSGKAGRRRFRNVNGLCYCTTLSVRLLVLEVIVRYGIPQVLCALWLIGSFDVLAAEIAGLFETEVAVQARDEAARGADMLRALQQVLSRLVTTDLLQSDKLRSIQDHAQAYVLQYGYVDAPAAEGQAAPRQVLRVVFDEPKLTAALRERGVSIFGAQRPDVLAWIAVTDGQQQQLVSGDSMPEIGSVLREVARERGLPLLLPLMDLSDQQNLSFDDVWAGNDERIRQASMRYDAKAVLAGRLQRQAGGGWDANWRFYQPGAVNAWQGSHATVAEALQLGLRGVYDRLAAQHASARPAKSKVDLQVSGIVSLENFVRVVEYLQSLSSVRSVDWLRVEPDAVLFRLGIDGDRSTLEEALSPGLVLQPAAPEQTTAEMNYRLASP
jgi:hypothetical protein